MMYKSVRPPTLLALTAVLLAASLFAQAELSVTYTLHPDVENREIDITMEIAGIEGNSIDIAIPDWSPGFYRLRNYEENISGLKVTDADGEPIEFAPVTPNIWRVEDPGELVLAEYSVASNDMTYGFMNIWVSEENAFLAGPAGLLYVLGHQDADSAVACDIPEGWKHACALPFEDGHYIASSYDELADSPVEMGVFERHDFSLDGVPHSVIVTGSTAVDRDELVEMCKKVVRVQVDFFGGFPYDQYIFFYHAGGGGGIEHCNCTVIGMGGSRLPTGVTSHEFFHTWNVKRLRPKVLVPFDYQKEARTNSLWFCEGTTDYYSALLLHRCGLSDKDSYYRRLGSTLNGYLNNDAREEVTLEESSWKAWDGYGTGYGGISYYTNGFAFSLLLDLKIREATDNEKSLDDVMRYMWERYGKRIEGFEDGDILKSINKISGCDLSEFYELCVRTTETMPVDECLACAGLELSREEFARPDLGFFPSGRGGNVTARRVTEGGPAETAGIQEGDEILEIDGEPPTGRGWMRGWRGTSGEMTPGDEVEVKIKRGEEELALKLVVGERKEARYTVAELADATDRQLAIRSGHLEGTAPGHP